MKAMLLRRKRLGLGSCRGICEVSTTGLTYIRNDQMTDPDFVGIDMVIRWGCTSSVPVSKVLNTAKAIHLSSNKAEFRSVLCNDDTTKDNTPHTIFDKIEAQVYLSLGNPLFVRPRLHAQGRKAYLVKTQDELQEALTACGEGWYASEYINKKQEFRVFVVQGRVVWVANKIPADPSAICWNVAQGGKFENVRWDDWLPNVMQVAVNSFKLSGLDFGGVDIVVDENGKAWNIEINSAPSQTSPYRQSCTAKAFDYIVENGKEHFDLDSNHSGWRHYIHPAIWSSK